MLYYAKILVFRLKDLGMTWFYGGNGYLLVVHFRGKIEILFTDNIRRRTINEIGTHKDYKGNRRNQRYHGKRGLIIACRYINYFLRHEACHAYRRGMEILLPEKE